MSLWKVLCRLNVCKSNCIERPRGEAIFMGKLFASPDKGKKPRPGEGTPSPHFQASTATEGLSARGPAGATSHTQRGHGGSLRPIKTFRPGVRSVNRRGHHEPHMRGGGGGGSGRAWMAVLCTADPDPTSTAVRALTGQQPQLSVPGDLRKRALGRCGRHSSPCSLCSRRRDGL